jgi:hypothetical protein
VTAEKPSNAMDDVLNANRERENAHMELVNQDGSHVAWVTKVYPGDMNPIAEFKGRHYMRVAGLRNVWREVYVSRVAED